MRETPLTVEEIATLPDEALGDRVWLRSVAYADTGDPESLLRLHAGVRAYLATHLFEWQVGNGGLHQYFFNFPSPQLLQVVLDGYSFLGLDDVRALLDVAVHPLAAREQEWRESLRDGRIETFFGSYPETQLSQFDNQVGFHDKQRIAYVRGHPELFAR